MNEEFPTIEEILENRAILLLGAGSSMRYGFPSWEDLFDDMRNLSKQKDCSQLYRRFMEVLLSYEKRIKIKKDKLTLDTAIAKVLSDLNYQEHQRMFIKGYIEKIISEYEQKDRKQPQKLWAERFSDIVLDQVKNNPKSIFNLSIISTNYDRCFMFKFFPPIFHYYLNFQYPQEEEFANLYKTSLQKFFTIYQPHGSLGPLDVDMEGYSAFPIFWFVSENGIKYRQYRNSRNVRGYGDERENSGEIELVGEHDDLDKNYEKINSELLPANICISLGHSKKGIEGMKIDWSKVKKLYYFGSKKPNLSCLDEGDIVLISAKDSKYDEKFIELVKA